MKSVTYILLLVLVLAGGVILYTAMTGDDKAEERPAEAVIDPTLPAEEQAAVARETRQEAARGVCRDALLATLEDPDSAQLEEASEWSIAEPPDGTIHVRLSAQITTAIGMDIDGTWDCVVLPDEKNGMRLVSLTMVGN